MYIQQPNYTYAWIGASNSCACVCVFDAWIHCYINTVYIQTKHCSVSTVTIVLLKFQLFCIYKRYYRPLNDYWNRVWKWMFALIVFFFFFWSRMYKSNSKRYRHSVQAIFRAKPGIGNFENERDNPKNRPNKPKSSALYPFDK